jgi:hypothetical protein
LREIPEKGLRRRIDFLRVQPDLVSRGGVRNPGGASGEQERVDPNEEGAFCARKAVLCQAPTNIVPKPKFFLLDGSNEVAGRTWVSPS